MSKKKKKSFPKNPQQQNKKVELISFLENPKYSKIFFWSSILFPVVIIISFFNSLYRNSINFPFYDDFEAILEFLRQYITSSSTHEKLRLLLEQHSEHRLVFDRLISLFEYYLFGQVNFKSFVIIGHLAMVLACFLFYKAFQLKEKINFIYLLPIAAVIFNFRYFETSFWPMAALQNLWVLCFALGSFYFLHKETKYSLYISILCGWAATFTSANGIMTFLVGSFVLLLTKNLFNKKSLIWVGCGILAAGIYFYHYAKPEHHPEIIKPMMENPLGFLGYVFAFLGGNFSEDATTAIAIGVGLVLIALFITYKKFQKDNPVIYTFTVFLIVTSILAALTRFGFGLGQALSSKYTINSAVLSVSCYIALTSLFHKKMKMIFILAITALAIYFHFGTYNKYLPAKKSEKEEFEKNYALVTQGKLSHFNYGWPPLDERKDLPKRELKAADSIGYFKFKFTEEADILKNIHTDASKEIKYKLDRFEQVQMNAIVMQGWAFIKGESMENMTTVLCFKDEKMNPVKYFICTQNTRQDITQANAADNVNYNMSGFFTFYNPKEVPKGKYMLTIIITDGNFKAELNTGQILNF